MIVRSDRSAFSLAGRPCLIIGVRECRQETANILCLASVEATSVVVHRARVRRFRRTRTLRISGLTSQDSGSTAGSLRASLIASPHWGHSGAVSGSFRTSIDLGEHEGHCIASAESIFASPLTVQFCSPTRRKARAFPVGSSYPTDGQAPEWWHRLKTAFGTASGAFVAASLQQLIAAARLPGSGISETAVNASLAFIEGAKPQGEVECGLVMQMACTHCAAMSVLFLRQ